MKLSFNFVEYLNWSGIYLYLIFYISMYYTEIKLAQHTSDIKIIF